MKTRAEITEFVYNNSRDEVIDYICNKTWNLQNEKLNVEAYAKTSASKDKIIQSLEQQNKLFLALLQMVVESKYNA